MLGKRLLIEELESDEYEFTIYVHQFLSNFESPITSIDISFSIDVQFLTVLESDDFKDHQLQVQIKSEYLHTLTTVLIRSEIECLEQFPYIPDK